MAKLTTFNVPYEMTRDPQTGKPHLSLHEDKRTLVEEKPVELNGAAVMKFATEISQFNAQEQEIAKMTMFASDIKTEGFILMRILTE